MDFPEDLYYTEEHEWIAPSEDGTSARVGITDFAQRELGDIVFVELEPTDTELAQEAPFGTVEAVKTVSDLYMPVSGILRAHNERIEDHPELVNDDPYGEGWMIEVELTDPDELEGLMEAASYRSMVGE